MKSNENEFKNIWKKNCPECGRDQLYKWKKTYLKSLRESWKCKYCIDESKQDREYRNCVVCQTKFFVKRKSTKKYCSPKCYYGYITESGVKLKQRKKKQCEFCGKIIYYLDWEIKWHPFKFCSNKCNIANQMTNGFGKKTKPEMKMESILNGLYKEVKYNYEICGKYYDFYIPEKHLLVEVDGVYWHGKNVNDECLDKIQKRVRNNDLVKNSIANNEGFNLIRIWEDEVNIKYVSECVLR